jgi:HPt (histidine-containing phosphotransfer) domain-containing protein
MEERVAILESAAAALAANQLSIEQYQAAHAAAHKLAGVLGTFGLTEGTILAREAEAICSAESDLGPAAAARLTQIAPQLRAIVESRK